MKSRILSTVFLFFFVMALTDCSSFFARNTTEIPDSDFEVKEIKITTIPEEQDTTNVEDTYYEEEETLLARIQQMYDDVLNAFEESDFGLAETKIDSASVLSAQIDLDTIGDESLALRFRNTLASLFQDYGRILRKVDEIKEEDPMAWLDELTASDPEQFKNGQWTDDELRKMVKKIALRCDVPIDYNEQVKKSIYYFQTVKRKEMEKWQTRSGRYLPMIQKILEEEDLPLDMAYLSMIESGFSPKAYSRARAVGLWQFIYSTGRLYGLKRDQWIDERKDPVKSTKAAVQHLKDLYKLYDDWRLVMAAYNCGAGRVTRQRRAGNDDFWTMRLPRETRNFVPSFMAAVVISKAPELFGFEDIALEPAMEYDIVDVHPYTDLGVAAQCAGVDKQEMKKLNPELLGSRTPAGKSKYALKIPKGAKETFLTAYAKVPVEKYTPPRVSTYLVRRGDTPSTIARKFGVKVSTLMAINNISNPRRLIAGRRIKIPGYTSNITQNSQKPLVYSRGNSFNYKVKKNDSLWLLAKKNNTTVSTLQTLNNMGRSTKLIPGRKILIPMSRDSGTVSQNNMATQTITQPEQITYIIQKNDTLYEIAKRYNVSYNDIKKWNKIKNHRSIKPGQKIVIKLNEK